MNTNQASTKMIVARNLNAYIDASGRSASWIMSKTGMSKLMYDKLLKGEGDLDKHLEAIMELFGIDDPFYFHKIDFVAPKSIEEFRKESDMTTLAAVNYPVLHSEEHEFNETIEILTDFIDMMEILRNSSSSSRYVFEE